MTTAATDVPWQELQHAFGRAHDVPRVLAALSRSRGRRLRKQMERLWERVLHQGSIYSASPPAVQALIPLAAKATGRDRELYYRLLAEFASSARKAVRDGRAIPCCSGGDPEHGRAILAHLLEAREIFASNLESRHSSLRGLAADLLCCSSDAGTEAAMLVRRRFPIEPDRDTRMELLNALTRVSSRIEDWPGVLAATLEQETDPALRFALRRAQVRHFQGAVEEAAAAELTSLFTKQCAGGEAANWECFFDTLECLGRERELAALLATLERCSDRDAHRVVAERSLRLAFGDQRSGWENKSCSLLADGAAQPRGLDRLPSNQTVLIGLLKIAVLAMLWKVFPFLLRRKLRQVRNEKNRRRYRIDYQSVAGKKPELPVPLTSSQQRTLAALARNAEVWMDQTNLWALFDLPDSAAGLSAFLARRT